LPSIVTDGIKSSNRILRRSCGTIPPNGPIRLVGSSDGYPLLSGASAKERASDAHGGLLKLVGEFGILMFKDFGSVLSMQRDSLAAVLAALREIYDGEWTRHLGTDAGRTLHWQGKMGLVAGCTPTIDRHHAVMGAMGERFVLYRPPCDDDDKPSRRCAPSLQKRSRMCSTTPSSGSRT
jgi:hypothetical protein